MFYFSTASFSCFLNILWTKIKFSLQIVIILTVIISFYYNEINYRRSHLMSSVRKKVILEILQNWQENTCARVSFLIKVSATLLKKRLWDRNFSVKFVKFLSTLFFTEHLWAPASIIIKLFSLHCSWENSSRNQVWTIQKWSKILCAINQEILNASKDNHSNWKALQLIYT